MTALATARLAAPPGHVRLFQTRSPEEAHAFMCDTYVEHAMQITGRTDSFQMRHMYQESGHIGVGTLTHTMGVRLAAQPPGRLLFCRVLDGRVERDTARDLGRFSADDLFPAASPDMPYVCRWDTVTMQVISIDGGAFSGLPRLDGARGGAPPRATPDQATRRFCLDLIDYLTQEVMTNEEARNSPLITGSAARMLALALMTTFGASWGRAAPQDRADATPNALRRAVAYLESHADQDISPDDIAAAANVSYRAVQLAFRRHLDTTPMSYLRRIRLEQAHHELLHANPEEGATVSAVAAHWGFPNVSRFTTHYRRVYNAHPLDTLAT